MPKFSLEKRLGTLLLYAFIQCVSALAALNIADIPSRIGVHSLLATLLARGVRAPWWWIALHGTLPILGWILFLFHIPSTFYLIAFIILALVFGSGSLRRAPLFLSGPSAWSRISEHIPPQARVLDAGCGFAGLLQYLQHHRPDLSSLTGVELAWLPFCISKIRCYNTRINIKRYNFWTMDWAEYDVVFVFLSPDPMPAVWAKFKEEMQPGSWLISYHFEVPDQPPNWISSDDHGRALYGWQHV